MDKFGIDFKSLLPYAIEAFIYVLGEEYEDIISKKVSKACMIMYHDVEGLEDYLSKLRNCKLREFSIRFLEEIGIDVQRYKKDNYTEFLSDDILKIMYEFVGSTQFATYRGFLDLCSPLHAFKDTELKSNLEMKLKLINYLLDDNHEQITWDNFDSFSQTEEYFDLLKRIKQYNIIYERLLSEYEEWEKQLLPYEKYVEDENKRKDRILKIKKRELFTEIFDKLSIEVRSVLSKKSLKEQRDTILGSFNINFTSSIENFSYTCMEKLRSNKVNRADKYFIVDSQVNYLKALGVDLPDKSMLSCEKEEDVLNYLAFLEQDCVKKLIPSAKLISLVSMLRKRKIEEANKEYYMTRNDFIDIMKIFNNNSDVKEGVYKLLKEKRVCILSKGGFNGDGEFISIMFYGISSDSMGILFHRFMHEVGHIIDQNPNGCAFEPFGDPEYDSLKNPYDEYYRRYERFSEALDDMFAIEATEFLHKQGIYLIEPKEFTALNINKYNTSQMVKDVLKPLVQKFRSQVIRAKINAAPQELIRYIGENNFEELVDAVNKIDFLSRNGVKSKIENCLDDSIVTEYYEQIERVKRIYNNIDNYYANNYSELNNKRR